MFVELENIQSVFFATKSKLFGTNNEGIITYTNYSQGTGKYRNLVAPIFMKHPACSSVNFKYSKVIENPWWRVNGEQKRHELRCTLKSIMEAVDAINSKFINEIKQTRYYYGDDGFTDLQSAILFYITNWEKNNGTIDSMIDFIEEIGKSPDGKNHNSRIIKTDTFVIEPPKSVWASTKDDIESGVHARFGGLVLGMCKDYDTYKDGFTVYVSLKTIQYEKQLEFVKDNIKDIVKYAIESIDSGERLRSLKKKVGNIKYYKVTEAVLKRDSTIWVNFELKKEIQQILKRNTE